jgi:hypothetical protein
MKSSVGSTENSVALSKIKAKQICKEKLFWTWLFWYIYNNVLLKFGYKNHIKIYLKIQFSENNTI